MATVYIHVWHWQGWQMKSNFSVFSLSVDKFMNEGHIFMPIFLDKLRSFNLELPTQMIRNEKKR